MGMKKHFQKLGKGLKDLATEGVGVIREATTVVKQGVYEEAGRYEDQVRRREGIPGGIATVVETAVKTGKGLHAKVQAQGGYRKVASKALDDYVINPIHTTYTKFDESLFTNDEFDPVKAEKLLKQGGVSARAYGQKAMDRLATLAEAGFETIRGDYRAFVPSTEERAGKYAGIGSAYAGVLFREDFEECLAFYDQARAKIPSRLGVRDTILRDIKSSASSSAEELLRFYKSSTSGEVQTKITAVTKYI